MAKNMRMTRNANVVVPVPVPVDTVAGEVLFIGNDGLMGHALTDRQPAPDFVSEQSYVHGLEEGEASVELSGVALVVALPVTGLLDIGDAVYVSAADTYTGTATGNTKIGWALTESEETDGVIHVGLRVST